MLQIDISPGINVLFYSARRKNADYAIGATGGIYVYLNTTACFFCVPIWVFSRSNVLPCTVPLILQTAKLNYQAVMCHAAFYSSRPLYMYLLRRKNNLLLDIVEHISLVHLLRTSAP